MNFLYIYLYSHFKQRFFFPSYMSHFFMVNLLIPSNINPNKYSTLYLCLPSAYLPPFTMLNYISILCSSFLLKRNVGFNDCVHVRKKTSLSSWFDKMNWRLAFWGAFRYNFHGNPKFSISISSIPFSIQFVLVKFKKQKLLTNS